MAAPCPTAEVHFAQKLAANEKRTRDSAFKKLKKWLQSRSSDGKEADFLKIWKGLHYCMWMQDKPLIQEELSDNMGKLLHVFGNVDISLLFLGVFFQTESREWSGIDRWRMDKFMMLSREMLGQGLALLKKAKWKKDHIDLFCQVMKKQVLMAENDGYKIHVTDIYLDELQKAGAEVLSASQVIQLLEPFSTFLVESKNTTLVKRVISRIFDAIIQETVDDAKQRAERLLQREDEANNNGVEIEDSDDEDDDDTPLRLDYDYGAIADRLFELGKRPECLSRHRTLIYNVVKKFRDLNEGVLPTKENDYTDLEKGYINRDEFAKSVNKLISMETEVHRQKRKKKNRKRKKNQQKETEADTTAKKRKMESSSENNKTKSVTEENSETQTVQKQVKKETGLTKLKDKLLGKRKKDSESKEPLKKMKQADSSSGSQSVERPVVSSVKSRKTAASVKSSKTQEPVKISVTPVLTRTRTQKVSENGGKDFETPAFDVEESVSTCEKDIAGVNKKQPSHRKVPLDTLELKHIHDQEVGHKQEAEEEVEIWVPNKKYSGKLKGLFEKQGKGLEVKKFAQFEHGAQTPPAYVRKSVAKVAAPNTDPGKSSKKVAEKEKGSQSSKRKVTFDMKKNKAVDFKKSIQFSPAPYNPDKKPEQSILKTPEGTSQVNVSVATPHGTMHFSTQRTTRQQTPHVNKMRNVKRTPSSAKKLRTPASTQKYVGTPVPKKAAPVLSLKKSTPRAKAMDFF